MKKFLKMFCIMIIILMLLLTNFSYATNEILDSLDTNTSKSDLVKEEVLRNLQTENQDGIMLINEGTEVPISDNIEIPTNVIDNDIYLCEKDVSINDEINGNVYIIAETVSISSDYLNGNVFIMAKNATIDGTIAGSIYVMGENINIATGSVNTIYAIGKKVNLLENANVVNDFKVSAEELNINGNISRELNAYVENINIGDKSEYIAKGNVSYSGEYLDPSEILNNVKIEKHEKNEEKIEQTKSIILANTIKSEILGVCSTAIIILVIWFIIKNKEIAKVDNYSKLIVNNISTGFLSLIIIPIISIILLCTIIGIPIALILITLYILALFISVPVASIKVAQIIYEKISSSNKALIILYAVCVYIIVKLISLVPIIGGLINFLVVLFGLGIMVGVIFKSRKTVEKNDNIIIENK